MSTSRGSGPTRRRCSARCYGGPATVLNDADAAGVAEMTFGAGVGVPGTVLMVTFGTGIGSALFVDGTLVPNTELGHIEIHGKDAEQRASEHAKVLHDMSWAKWAGRVEEYMQHMEALLSPSLIIVGGGISKEADKWVPLLTGVQAKIVAATLHNDAGIVGGAMAALSSPRRRVISGLGAPWRAGRPLPRQSAGSRSERHWPPAPRRHPPRRPGRSG